jgi:hypothetical protein
LESQLVNAAEGAEEATSSEGSSVRRRGRRGGRRERERRDNLVLNGESPAGNSEAVAKPIAATTPTIAKPTEYIAYPDGYVPPLKPTEYVAMPTLPQAVVPAPLASSPVEPVAATKPLVSSANGLLQIETDHSKLVTIENTVATTDQPVVRRRNRVREVYVESEPLVQIETQHP